MKQILIILFISTLLPARLQAQRAYKEGTKIIFDLTVAAGMPAGAVTNVKKYTGTFTPRQDELGPNNDESSSINATVYHKLEIAPRDVNTSGNLDDTGALTMPWVDAFNTCKSLTYDGGGWRLPTQRELMLMFMFLPAFNTFLNDGSIYNGTPFADVNYWSSTEYRNDKLRSWFVNFSRGNTNSVIKTDYNMQRVRCVREVMVTP